MRSTCARVIAALAILSLPTVAAAQPADEDESSQVDPDDGGTVHESDEVIGPDGTETPPPDDEDPTAAPTDAAPTGNVGYDKGFFIKSDDGKFLLRIRSRVQPYLTMSRVKTPAADWLGAFEIRRARLVFEGNLHGDDLRYKFQTDFGKGNPTLKDYYADVRLGSGALWLRAGQWKRPFSRQQIASSGRLELADRAITDKAFGAGRDLGIALHNGYEDSPDIEWTVGVWNGTGDAATFDITSGPVDEPVVTVSNVPREFKPVFIGRVGLNSGGIKGYSEADLEGGPLRWAAAASFWAEADFDRNDVSSDKVQLDFVVKAQGFSTTGGLYASTQQVGIHTLSDQELAYLGFHLQAGYLVTPTLQPVARFALLDDRNGKPGDVKEITIGASYYGWGHDAKVQGDVRFLKTGDGKFTDAILFQLGSNIGF